MRIRQIIGSFTKEQQKQVRKLLPLTAFAVPDATTERYPSGILNALPAGESYAVLGCVAEDLLRPGTPEITVDTLIASVRRWVPAISDASITKIRSSKTTEPFLANLRTTRSAVEAVVRPEQPLIYNEAVTVDAVQGHPDMYNTTQVFEVKLTGTLKANWLAFLFQTFAYAALLPTVTDIYIVLPLQKTVWHSDVRAWAGRAAYLKVLQDTSVFAQTTGIQSAFIAAALREMYSIGVHAPKLKSLAGTIATLGDYSKPYQIFLGGPTTSKMSIPDEELALAANAVQKTGARVYVHSQYIINLCSEVTADSWAISLLQKNLAYTATMGGKGVVVHVGKSTDQPIPQALERMRAAITKVLESASPECPLLLETPAGQGSETLKDQKEFIEFVKSFGDRRLRVCLDTCHVFACGHDPLGYLKAVTTADPDLLRLVHFNDSQEACGSCLDRHAYIGTGKIGYEGMQRLAQFCGERGVPMVIE